MTLNWGTGIAMTYTAFALATSGFVAFAMARSVDLVTPDYYARSLQQDQRMRAVQNARELGRAASIEQTGAREVALRVPADHARGTQGTITLYRAADARADRVLELAPDAGGLQRLSLEGLPVGHWIVQCRWTAGGREHYMERAVNAR